VSAIVEDVRATEPLGRGVRWVRLEGAHITLRFLGPTEEGRIEALVAALTSVAAAAEPLDLELAGAGAFPSARRPRAIWLGVGKGATELVRLAGALNDALATSGWERDDRPFQPHLTLARADGVAAGSATAATLARAMEGRVIPSRVDRIGLFESVTGAGRAHYLSHVELPLG